ncbi:MAG TPA: VOC family protein [Vicinamibacteria bacterium]|nr:VOC family protein [Vicinamibacteria bacterium]
MLKDSEAMATVAVKDLAAARKFYEGTLGLELVHTEGEEALTFQTGASQLLVYRSQYAGTNRATAVTWSLDGDIESAVSALKGKGITFEHYDLPGMTREGDIHGGGGMKVAWFKDPDGNIHSLISE